MRSPEISVGGTLLILILTVLAFAGGRLFSRVTEFSPTPPVAALAPAELTPTPDAPPVPTATVPVTPNPLPSTFPRAPIACLDPGDGGSDRGFQRFDENGNLVMEEEPFDLAKAGALKERLERRSYQVVMTRETDAAVNLEGRDVNGDGRTAAHDRPGSDRTGSHCRAALHLQRPRCRGARQS